MKSVLLATVVLSGLLAGCVGGGVSDLGDDRSCPTATTLSQQEQVPNLSGAGRIGPSGSYDVVVETANATGWNAHQADCIGTIQVLLHWTNGPDAGADLYVAVTVPGTDVEVVGHDEQQLIADGAHTETVLAPTALEGFGGAALLEGIEVTVYSDWASLSANGLTVTIDVVLTPA